MRPNAHAVIQQIAALCLALAGRIDEGRVIVGSLRRTRPSCHIDEFLRTFKLAPDAETLFQKAAHLVGMD